MEHKKVRLMREPDGEEYGAKWIMTGLRLMEET